jgi:hypothetical protein
MLSARTHQLLDQAVAVLPSSEEEIITKGIAAETSERLVTLRQSTRRLQEKYGSMQQLETRLKQTGVTPDDHTLYTDLLEWRAANQELGQLITLLESL